MENDVATGNKLHRIFTGYAHPDYARSLSEFGTPRHLDNSDGWILKNSIKGSPAYDARGCYPIFTCMNWSGLCTDLESLAQELVSLVLVADPFGDFSPAVLSSCFPDAFFPYKEHYVVDLELNIKSMISKHHLRNVKKAQKHLEVERCHNPLEFIQQWTVLYANLIKRHNIKGIADFSKRSFSIQLAVPGLVMFRAICKEQTVGMMLWYLMGDVGYYHLSAYSDEGYKLNASHALFAYVIDYYRTRARWLNLGAGAGVHSDRNDGLSLFKQGWSTGTRTAYLCGRIFNRAIYDELSRERGNSDRNFFPAYRGGEVA